MVISVINSKGGIGKTTTAVNMAVGLKQAGYKVLLIDLDSQASASFSLGMERENLTPGADSVIFGEQSPESVIRKGTVDLIPGNFELANIDFSLSEASHPYKVVSDSFGGIRGYDFTIIDCPPSTSLLTVGSIYTSDGYIIPVQPHYLALEGLKSFQETINKAKESFGIRAENLGILITMADYRSKATKEIIGLLREAFKGLMFDTEIRINTKLAEAPSFGKDIYSYDPNSTGAQAYTKFTNELLNRISQ